jgi:hypothetical protein
MHSSTSSRNQRDREGGGHITIAHAVIPTAVWMRIAAEAAGSNALRRERSKVARRLARCHDAKCGRSRRPVRQFQVSEPPVAGLGRAGIECAENTGEFEGLECGSQGWIVNGDSRVVAVDRGPPSTRMNTASQNAVSAAIMVAMTRRSTTDGRSIRSMSRRAFI